MGYTTYQTISRCGILAISSRVNVWYIYVHLVDKSMTGIWLWIMPIFRGKPLSSRSVCKLPTFSMAIPWLAGCWFSQVAHKAPEGRRHVRICCFLFFWKGLGWNWVPEFFVCMFFFWILREMYSPQNFDLVRTNPGFTVWISWAKSGSTRRKLEPRSLRSIIFAGTIDSIDTPNTTSWKIAIF